MSPSETLKSRKSQFKRPFRDVTYDDNDGNELNLKRSLPLESSRLTRPIYQKDSDCVMDHYNSRRNTSRMNRRKSPIIKLRSFNNWIKFVLIYTGIKIFSRQGRKPYFVFDIAGGKGGDLGKWANTGIQHLVIADIATTSIEHALQRYNSYRKPAFSIDFISADCCKPGIQKHLEKLGFYYDIVSCQFALHYSFENEERAKHFMNNISVRMAPGAVFICTIPDENVIKDGIKASKENWFGNDIYRLTFLNNDASSSTEKEPDNKFGIKYQFTLCDAVNNVPEYVVNLNVLNQLAGEHDLSLVHESNFREFYEENKNSYKDIFFQMQVPDNLALSDPISWEAICLYRVLIYQKKSDQSWVPNHPTLPTIKALSKKDIVLVDD